MSYNPIGKQTVEVPLSVFGGLVTEMSPTDLPGGVSPDCQDLVFVPGTVSSRPGLHKVFATGLDGATMVMYGKSCVLPIGRIVNFYLDSGGHLWTEDPATAPGVATKIFDTVPGTYAKSVSAFGREYFAFSDGLHGTDIPLQYDGTNLDRVTQYGPGAPPTVQSLSLPAVQLQVTGVPPTLTIVECDPAQQQGGGYYTAINIFVSGSSSPTSVGNSVTISGSSASFNGTYTVNQVYDNVGGGDSLIVVAAYLPPGTGTATGGTLTIGSGYTLQRAGNIVTANTQTPHNLQVGYQVQISGIPVGNVGGSISSIKIANDDSPGVATIITAQPHGLVPGLQINLKDIPGVAVGGGISSIKRAGGVVTVVTSSSHKLSSGAEVTISGVVGTGGTNFDTTSNVLSVPAPDTFTYAQTDTDDSAGAGGSVVLNWPSLQAATPNFYTVQSAPDALTFQVAINYADGTWSGGSVKYAWDGKFFVSRVLSDTEFTYSQSGPNDVSIAAGTVTPYGQASPGSHQVQVAFLTRQGYITRPSPPVTFTANGGQYILVSNIPIGPENVRSRIILFTGANGSYFFYIPTAAVINGQVVSTSTQIYDNFTTSALLDFSDNTLYSSVACSIPGNNLASQIVLDSSLGFAYYDSRLIAYGQRNCVQNFQNLHFDGGYLPNTPTLPSGWFSNSPSGTLVNTGRHLGAWQITVTPGTSNGFISQSAYQDAYGAPIIHPDTWYRVRLWAFATNPAAGMALNVSLSSELTGFGSIAILNGATLAPGFHEALFGVKMPTFIPPDLRLSVYVSSDGPTGTVTVDEISVVYEETPYTDLVAFGSYVNNPEAFDGLTGKFGPAEDTKKIMDLGMVRSNLYIFTREPSGRIHQTSANGTTEPAGWTITQVGANCGVLSAFSLAKSQADDATAGGGEEWLMWASSSGVRIFGGDQPYKLSQEIQPDWDSINKNAMLTLWALNDPIARVCYFGLPTGSATAPNLIYPLNYKGQDTPYEIHNADPIRTNYSGRMLATDNNRKWNRWNIAARGAALMYRTVNETQTCFFGGSFGNVYTLDRAKLTDDDYGQIVPYYITYYFVGHEEEMGLQLGAHRKMLAYFQANISGTGNVKIEVLCNTATNVWPFNCIAKLSTDPNFDLEWGGGNAQSQRMAFKISVTPAIGTDVKLDINKVIATLRPASRMPVRGSTQ